MTRFFGDFKDGVNAYFRAFSVIREAGLWIYVLIPGIISLAFGLVMVFFAQAFSSDVTQFIESRYPWELGADFIRRISAILGQVIVWAGTLMTYKYVVLILVAPFMSPFSERIEAYMTGHFTSGSRLSPWRIIKEIFRGIRLTIRNLIRELLLSLGVLAITGLMPVLGIISAPAVFGIQAYFAGFGNMDFTLERHFDVKGSIRFVRDYKGLAVGNGVPFLLMLMIPVIGVFLAPSLATAAATIETVERLEFEGSEELSLVV